MQTGDFLLVEAAALPEVFTRVLQAKDMLASGEAKNVSHAVRLAGISRSAFYKYKDSVFRAGESRDTLTLTATLLDETGALQSLLAGLSAAGASVVTINQSMPENGTAKVAVVIRTGAMRCDLPGLFEALRGERTLVDVRTT